MGIMRPWVPKENIQYSVIHTAVGSSSRPYPVLLSELAPYYNALTNKDTSIIKREGTTYYYFGADCYIGIQRTTNGNLFVRVFDMSACKCYEANNSLSFTENATGFSTGLSLAQLESV